MLRATRSFFTLVLFLMRSALPLETVLTPGSAFLDRLTSFFVFVEWFENHDSLFWPVSIWSGQSHSQHVFEDGEKNSA